MRIISFLATRRETEAWVKQAMQWAPPPVSKHGLIRMRPRPIIQK